MDLLASPRPDLTQPAGEGIGDAVIKEARRRARRRRLTYAALAVAAALLGLSAVVDLQSTPTPPTASGPDAPSSPDTAAAPVVPRESTKVIADWAGIHQGWVVVYADGRALWSPDTYSRPSWVGQARVLERRLGPRGIDLVRTGLVEAAAFIQDPESLPPHVWAEPEARTYAPSHYSICTIPRGVPPEARTVLRGQKTTTFPKPDFQSPLLRESSPDGDPCYKLTVQQATAFVASIMYEPPSLETLPGFEFRTERGDIIGVAIDPVLPGGTTIRLPG